jgi:hypothetical protein
VLDWKIRLETIENMLSFSENFHNDLNQSTKFMTFLEAFCKGLSDSNLKVQIKTLTAMENAIPLFKVRDIICINLVDWN